MKTLIIISHPNIAESTSQQFFLAGLDNREEVTIRHLERAYPEGKIDKVSECQLVREHDRLIFQFPLYWYSSPALLKEWQDQVLTEFTGSNLLKDKEFGIVTTVGVRQIDYLAGGKVGFTLDELMRPYQAVANHFEMRYLPIFSIHQFMYLSEKDKKRCLVDYLYYITGDSDTSLSKRTEWLLHELSKSQTHLKSGELVTRLESIIATVGEKADLLEDLKQTLDEF